MRLLAYRSPLGLSRPFHNKYSNNNLLAVSPASSVSVGQ
jgi:hypothetical protein